MDVEAFADAAADLTGACDARVKEHLQTLYQHLMAEYAGWKAEKLQPLLVLDERAIRGDRTLASPDLDSSPHDSKARHSILSWDSQASVSFVDVSEDRVKRPKASLKVPSGWPDQGGVSKPKAADMLIKIEEAITEERAKPRVSVQSGASVQSGSPVKSASFAPDIEAPEVTVASASVSGRGVVFQSESSEARDVVPEPLPRAAFVFPPDHDPGMLATDGDANEVRSSVMTVPSVLKAANKPNNRTSALRSEPRASDLRVSSSFMGRGSAVRGSCISNIRGSFEAAEGVNLVHTPRTSQEMVFEPLEVWTKQQSKGARRSLASARTSRINLDDEVDEIVQTGWCRRAMITPNSKKNLTWNLFGLLCITYDCVTVPLEAFSPPDTDFTVAMSWLLRIFWTVNIPISFMIGHVRSTGSVEMSPIKAARRYALSWLPLDIFMVFIDWAEVAAMGSDGSGNFMLEVGGSLRTIRTFRMLRVLRFFRLMKAQEISNFVSENIRSEKLLLFATIFKIMLSMIGLTHLVCCLWWAAGKTHSPPNWIATEDMEDELLETQYLKSFHWALSTLAGDTLYMPQNTLEKTFTVVTLFFTFVVASSFVSSITTAMTRLQIISNEESRKISILKRYLADHNISQGLKIRVQRNAQHAMEQHQKNMPETSVDLLKMISEPLRVELHFEVHSFPLTAHPFFKQYNNHNTMGLRKVCHVAMEPFNISSGDVLFMDHEKPPVPRMFFLLHGRMMYEQESRKHRLTKDGAWISEGTLWTSWWHCGNLRAVSECQMLRLDAKKFQDVCSQFPLQHCQVYAQEFVNWINRTDRTALTDISEMCDDLEECILFAFPDDTDTDSSDEDVINSSRRSSITSQQDGPLRNGKHDPKVVVFLQWATSMIPFLSVRKALRRRIRWFADVWHGMRQETDDGAGSSKATRTMACCGLLRWLQERGQDSFRTTDRTPVLPVS